MNSYPDDAMRRLWETLERLLGPGGCPWDRRQKPEDLARYLIDEGHEWLEAVQDGRPGGPAEEIGDLAYLLLFALIELREREGSDPGEVLGRIDEKLRRRHPDIFGEEAGRGLSSEEQTRRWEEIKRAERAEKGEPEGLLKPLPRSLGALAKAHRYQETAATVGFDWPDLDGVLDKPREETAELQAVLDEPPRQPPAGEGPPSRRFRESLESADLSRARDELGDVAFVLANLCRWLGQDAEEVAESGNAKFLRRFGAMESSLREAGGDLHRADLPEMESHWRKVKEKERG